MRKLCSTREQLKRKGFKSFKEENALQKIRHWRERCFLSNAKKKKIKSANFFFVYFKNTLESEWICKAVGRVTKAPYLFLLCALKLYLGSIQYLVVKQTSKQRKFTTASFQYMDLADSEWVLVVRVSGQAYKVHFSWKIQNI